MVGSGSESDLISRIRIQQNKKKDPVGSTKNVSGYSWEPNPAPQSATLELFIQTDELLVGMLDFIRSLSSANLSISGENSAFENIGIEICYLNIGIGIFY